MATNGIFRVLLCVGTALCAAAAAGCAKSSPGTSCDPATEVCVCHGPSDCPPPYVCGAAGQCTLPGPDGGADAAVPVDASAIPDAAAADAAPKLGFGEPCSDKQQCESNICVLVATGGFCSQLCAGGTCPQGYGCVGVLDAVEQGVVSDVCMPEGNLLCTACATDVECSLIGQDLCLEFPVGGRFCARDCRTVDCPAGYTCEDVTLGGNTYRQCLPESGACGCDASNAGTLQTCAIATPFGDCEGTMECQGASGWGPCEPPSATDEPDPAFVDDNCDGIDGEAGAGIYVAPTGTDSGSCGLDHSSPCATVGRGITRAVATGRAWVYLQAGTYNEVVTLASGVHLVGGYDASWQRDDRNQPGHTVTLLGGLDPATAQYITVKAENLTAPTRILDLMIVGPDAAGDWNGTGMSSYAVYVSDANSLSLERVTLEAGDGADGLPGNPGTDASQVRPGSGGAGGNAREYTTACDTSRQPGGSGGTNTACSSNTAGGNGGQGGQMDTSCTWGVCTNCSATAGLPGANGAQYVSGGPGYRGAGGGTCNMAGGGDGQTGRVTDGAGGSGAGGAGAIIAGFWYGASGGDGTLGENGGGGGGGGGSGGCDGGTDSYGAGGGGGGAGGCRAPQAGTGGHAGGGSFGVFARSSTVIVQDCTIIRGNGGAGGAGGAGGLGQPGGLGGSGGLAAGDSGPGGDGGDGGRGGHSGGGGGGAGGISYGIFSYASTISQSGNTFSSGSGGPGGAGGASPGSAAGNPGQTGAVGDVGTCQSESGC